MSASAAIRVTPPPPKPRKVPRPPISYTVEVVPGEPDPKAAEKVAAWLRERLR